MSAGDKGWKISPQKVRITSSYDNSPGCSEPRNESLPSFNSLYLVKNYYYLRITWFYFSILYLKKRITIWKRIVEHELIIEELGYFLSETPYIPVSFFHSCREVNSFFIIYKLVYKRCFADSSPPINKNKISWFFSIHFIQKTQFFISANEHITSSVKSK